MCNKFIRVSPHYFTMKVLSAITGLFVIVAHTVAAGAAVTNSSPIFRELLQNVGLDDGEELFQQVLQKCSVDWDAFVEVAEEACTLDLNDPAGIISLFSQASSWYEYLKNIGQSTCSEDQIDNFESSLEDFHQCAGFDLKAFLETGLSAIEGAEIECLFSFVAENDLLSLGMTAASGGSDFAVPERCVNEILGSNPFGDAVRTMFLRPDSVLPCFAELHKALPACTYETWPVPIVGQWLKTSSCIISESKFLAELLWTGELTQLETCFSHEYTCNMVNHAYCSDSILMSLPRPLLGAPVPDTLQRVAEGNNKASVVATYQSLMDKCVTNTWEGWSTAPGQNGAANTVFAAQKTSAKEATGAGSGGCITGAFFGGAVFSALLIGVVFAIHQKRNTDRSEFKPIDTEGIELS